MKVVKEGFLPKMDLRPGVRMWKLNGRGKGTGVALEQLMLEMLLEPLP